MLTAAVLLAALAAPASPFQVGEPVPTLSLPGGADGEPASLEDFRGQKVMLHVWASW